MDAKERLQSLVDRQGLCRYISATPALLSLFYDINRMPEQWIRKQDGPEWRQIALISHAWCMREEEHAAAVKAAKREVIEESAQAAIAYGRRVLAARVFSEQIAKDVRALIKAEEE